MTDVMILAAGLGTRMKSRRAKVLHELAGRPLIAYVLRAAFELAPEAVFTIVGHQAEEVEGAVRDQAARLIENHSMVSPDLQFVMQPAQKGTGHAVMAAHDRLTSRRGPLVIVAGDAPLIGGATLKNLVETHRAEKNDVTMLTVMMDDPTGYGRIIRNEDGSLLRCVEQKDASPEELAVREVGVSIYCVDVFGSDDRRSGDDLYSSRRPDWPGLGDPSTSHNRKYEPNRIGMHCSFVDASEERRDRRQRRDSQLVRHRRQHNSRRGNRRSIRPPPRRS